MSRDAIRLKRARCTNKRILLSGNYIRVAVLSDRLVHDNPFFHAQQDRHLVGFPAPSLFTPSEHLIRCSRVYSVLTGERLN